MEKAAYQAVLAFQGLLVAQSVEFSPHRLSRSRTVSVRDLRACKHGDELSTSWRYIHLWTALDWSAVGTIAIVAGSESRGRLVDRATGEKEVLASQGLSCSSLGFLERQPRPELTSQVRPHTEKCQGLWRPPGLFSCPDPCPTETVESNEIQSSLARRPRRRHCRGPTVHSLSFSVTRLALRGPIRGRWALKAGRASPTQGMLVPSACLAWPSREHRRPSCLVWPRIPLSQDKQESAT